MKLNLGQWIQMLVAYWTQGKGSFRLGPAKVTIADVPGKPNHLTLAQFEQVAIAAFFGQYGALQVGDISVTVAPWS